jgi:aspartyl-tRNA(Asn)/glutamyl-tRNA(Gln) amidotransferase subunit A
MDEFAMGSTNMTSAYGPTINPWKRSGDNTELVPGGSSGGSSAAVAARSCMASLGSDTGGSVRQPAAFTGTVGIKPTYGRCSRFGMIAFASSLDQAGVFARTVKDAALVLESISGYDQKDSTSYNAPVEKFSLGVGQSLKGKRIGIPKEYTVDGLPEEITSLWEQGARWLKEQGAEVIDISLPHTKYALPTYYIIAPAEASSNLARFDGVRYGNRVMPDKGGINDMYQATRTAGFGKEVKRRIMIGTYVLSAGFYDAYYTKAQKMRRLISNDFDSAFEKVDAILTPTTPSPAFALNEPQDDPVKMYLNDIFTVTVNLAGLPGISVPAGMSKEGLPLGLQVIGKKFDEKGMIAVATGIEAAAGFKLPNF